ncbi:MAG: 50S ribosomal protein L4 [candidate division TM6 bacterium GW2011_GWF2_28_16]|nr:MAG: 50S ribosomal protein L4 [candidate division TM6 bacterium GW2011_GWF2_28_16]
MNQIVVYNAAGEIQDKLNLDIAIIEKELSPKTYSYAIKALRLNWRQGTAACKDRGEVAFSNKKPWKQKGTGRARASSLRSPLWRKGGVTFGPQPRTRTLSINKKQVKFAMNNIFTEFINQDNKIYCSDFDSSKDGKPNTKQAYSLLKGLGLENKKVVFFLPFEDEMNFVSFRNIPNVFVVSFSQPNAYDLANCDCWLFLKKDLDLFKKMVSAWN